MMTWKVNPVGREIELPGNQIMEEEILENEFDSENDEFSEEHTPGNDDEFETDQGSLPDLEDDPIQTQEHVVRTVQNLQAADEERRAGEKECWVCFQTESETPDAEWVRPCRCAGSVGWVHQDCVKRWVEEKQKSNVDMEVECPQCQTKYRFVFPKMGKIFMFMHLEEQVLKQGVNLVTIGGIVYGIHLAVVYYSRNVLKCMVANELNFMGDKECSLSPYKEILADNFSDFVTETTSRITLPLIFVPQRIMMLCRETFKVLNYLYFAPFQWFKDVIISLGVPFVLYQFRRINWDEPLLKKLEERNQITSRYEPVLNTNKSHRRLIGGLLMPFASRLVGDICFSDMTVGKRFLFGAATYLLVKGSVSFIRKYKFRNWLRARKVKHFKEGENSNVNELPHLPYQFDIVIN